MSSTCVETAAAALRFLRAPPPAPAFLLDFVFCCRRVFGIEPLPVDTSDDEDDDDDEEVRVRELLLRVDRRLLLLVVDMGGFFLIVP